MAMKFSLFIISFILGIAVSSCIGISSSNVDPTVNQNQTWCMVKVSAPSNKLQAFIDYACGKYDCKEIKPGGSCYEPQKVESYASYALDLDYRATGTCNPELGTTTVTDPSYGSCKYP